MNIRRQLTVALGMTALAPLSSLAQQQGKVWHLGVLLGGSASDPLVQAQLAALRKELRKLGLIEDRDIKVEIRWGEGNINLMRTEAESFVSRKLDLIAVSTATALREVQRATSKTPIVFWAVSDPVGNKFVESLVRPGGNTTGFSLFEYDMCGKWLQLLKEAAPNVKRILALMSSNNPNLAGWMRELESAASVLKLEVIQPKLVDAGQIEPAITSFARLENGGLLSLPDPFLSPHRKLIATAALSSRLPSISGLSIFAQEGGLLSYGIDQVDLATRAASYVGKILKGAKPGDLAIQRPTKFELVVNTRTAKALEITVPKTLLFRADDVLA